MSEALTAGDGVKTYRGSSIEELLPRIREDLGREAVILRQREGLVGGIGGFFQKKCIEVDARAGGARIDTYDEEPQDGWEGPARDDADGARVLSQGEGGAAGRGVLAPPAPVPPAGESSQTDGTPPVRDDAAQERLAGPQVQKLAPADGVSPAGAEASSIGGEALFRNDAATREGLESPAVRKVVEGARPFADLLGELGEPPPTEPQPALERRARAEALVEGMVAAGLGEDLAAEVVDAVVASSLPFATAARLRTLVRNELALRIPVAPAPAPGPRALALVGPAGAGKTAAVAGICAAHAAAGASVTCLAIGPSDGGAALRGLLDGSGVALAVAEGPARVAAAPPVRPAAGEQALLVVDTPPVWADAPGLADLAEALAALGLDEVHATIRAGTAAAAGSELLAGLAPLAPNRLLASGLGETAHLGSIADVAIRGELPIGYLAESRAEIAPADPRELASRIVP